MHGVVNCFLVSDSRQQIHANIQPGLFDSVARALERLPAVAGADAAGVSQQQLAGHRRTGGDRSAIVYTRR